MAKKKVDYNLIDYIPEDEVPYAYSNGLIGAYADVDAMACLLAASQTPLFGVTAFGLAGTGAGRVITPYLFALKCDPEFGRCEAQTTGDCVSHGTRNGGMIDYCCDVVLKGNLFNGRWATENIYGWRGHGGQGASCARLADYVTSKGGFLVRKSYTNGSKTVDLSTYNSRTGASWGIGGTPAWLNEIAKEHRAETVALITTIEEARDALANGYGINACSGYGFSSKRNADGVADQRGSWSHAMAWIGCDDSDWAHQNYGGMLFLIQNSWGVWNSGGKRHDQPDGSFWIRESVAKKIISHRAAFAISNVKGFPGRKLDYNLI